MVLVAGWHEIASRATALTDAEEDVVERLVLVHDGAFLHGEVGGRVADDGFDGVGGAGPGYEVGVRGHFELLDAGPVAAEGKVVGGIGGLLEYVGIDQVVACVLRETDGAVVGPGARGQGGGGCDADFGVLRVDVGDGVVAVVRVSTLCDGGRLDIVSGLSRPYFYVSRQAYPDILIVANVYASSILQYCTFIGPRTLEDRRSGDGNVIAGCKTPVHPVLKDDARVVYPGAIPVTRPRIRVLSRAQWRWRITLRHRCSLCNWRSVTKKTKVSDYREESSAGNEQRSKHSRRVSEYVSEARHSYLWRS
jgi:hypothetical protein